MKQTLSNLPQPQVNRWRTFTGRKLKKEEKQSRTPYVMVPRFFDSKHPTNAWLVNTVATQNEKELNRVLLDKSTSGLLKFEPDPAAIQAERNVMRQKNRKFVITKAKYFQILDRPELYDKASTYPPLFNRHAVLYLTPLGLAIYLRKYRTARQLMECINRDTNRKHVRARQPQFVTCFSDRFGDLMCLYDHNLAMLNESFDILQLMLWYGNWFPMEPFKLVYRKKYIETYLSFDDYMDYAFYILLTRQSSWNITRLAEAMIRKPSEHFNLSYLSQPSRALKITMIRDADKVINNCKTYPRRLLRCAFYADRKLRSSLNLINAASAFAQAGIFKLVGEPALPFNPKQGRRKRLETLPNYKPRSREPNVEWPHALREFDADCCIALVCGLLSKTYRLGKRPSFEAALHLAAKILADANWLNYFSRISDLEFKDYFMGLDDAEKLRFSPEIFSYVRECVKLKVYENRYDLADFFSDTRLAQTIKEPQDVLNNDLLRSLVQCTDGIVSEYVGIAKGEELKPVGTVIGGQRCRGEGRDDPKNRYYTDRMEFPAESVKTMMTNTANVNEDVESSSSSSSEFESASDQQTSDSRRQRFRRFATLARLVDSEVVSDNDATAAADVSDGQVSDTAATWPAFDSAAAIASAAKKTTAVVRLLPRN